MRRRSVDIALPADLAQSLGQALSAYAHAAFPEGGSECAQVSRETLLDTARRCRDHGGGPLPLRRRQLAQLRAAVNWYFSEVEPAAAERGAALGACLSDSAGPGPVSGTR
jgi:hypothetical protein